MALAALLQDASIPDACIDAIAQVLSVEVSVLQYVEAQTVPARLELMIAVAVDTPGQSPTVSVISCALVMELPFDVLFPCHHPLFAVKVAVGTQTCLLQALWRKRSMASHTQRMSCLAAACCRQHMPWQGREMMLVFARRASHCACSYDHI